AAVVATEMKAAAAPGGRGAGRERRRRNGRGGGEGEQREAGLAGRRGQSPSGGGVQGQGLISRVVRGRVFYPPVCRRQSPRRSRHPGRRRHIRAFVATHPAGGNGGVQKSDHRRCEVGGDPNSTSLRAKRSNLSHRCMSK